ncbi:hypothetical protein BJV78DRAFT_1223542 [Lactifluus subvellereus]|nr:hypothetical protein BJV78DRAFT_1223542 [Lactifluus subvellereus]
MQNNLSAETPLVMATFCPFFFIFIPAMRLRLTLDASVLPFSFFFVLAFSPGR